MLGLASSRSQPSSRYRLTDARSALPFLAPTGPRGMRFGKPPAAARSICPSCSPMTSPGSGTEYEGKGCRVNRSFVWPRPSRNLAHGAFAEDPVRGILQKVTKRHPEAVSGGKRDAHAVASGAADHVPWHHDHVPADRDPEEVLPII